MGNVKKAEKAVNYGNVMQIYILKKGKNFKRKNSSFKSSYKIKFLLLNDVYSFKVFFHRQFMFFIEYITFYDIKVEDITNFYNHIRLFFTLQTNILIIVFCTYNTSTFLFLRNVRSSNM